MTGDDDEDVRDVQVVDGGYGRADRCLPALSAEPPYQYGERVLAPVWEYDSGTDIECSDADFEFIAHSRTDIPYLLAELDAARAENERLRACLHYYSGAILHMKPEHMQTLGTKVFLQVMPEYQESKP